MNREIRTSTHALTEAEQKTNEDVYWAQHDAEVEKCYGGQWVVPLERRIVAHGSDPETVLREAALVTQRPAEELAVCAVPHPQNWLADA
jgi:hypothetical protein